MRVPKRVGMASSSGKMTDDHLQNLRQLHTTISGNLVPSTVLGYLYQEYVINDKEMEEIKKLSNTSEVEAAELLLKTLKGKNDKAFGIFCDSLCNAGLQWLSDELKKQPSKKKHFISNSNLRPSQHLLQWAFRRISITLAIFFKKHIRLRKLYVRYFMAMKRFYLKEQ